MSNKNPLLSAFETPFGVPQFDSIELEHYKPAIEELIKASLESIDELIQSSEAPTFENTIVALEKEGELLGYASSIFFNLNSCDTNDKMQALANEISPMLTEHGSQVMQNAQLFDRVKAVYENELDSLVDPEDKTLLEKTYKSFVRSGANLSDDDKKKYVELSKELSLASLKFGENVLAATNAYELVLEDEKDLAGLPETALEAAALAAKNKGYEGKWLINLQAPSFIPFMEYAERRELREKLFKAYMSKAYDGGDLDNQELVKKIVKLRTDKASLLGYDSHSQYVLEERMAESADTVVSFLTDLLDQAYPFAEKEVEEVKELAKEMDGIEDLQRWDWAYYSQKLKDKKFSLNDELLRPYFELEKSVNGMFEVANKLYGLTFEKNDNIPVYHSDVTAYDVKDEAGNHVSVFYTDFFPRESKRGGAWMTSYRGQWRDGDAETRPIVSIVCNFTPPTDTKPSLLTYNEVETLFHEFGHALHGMLADGKYDSLSGTNVFWDFVELPSQILENWVQEKECLDLFAVHYQTGEKIPEEYIEKIKATSNFHEGYQTVRQLSFGLMDMAWHSLKPEETDIKDVAVFEQKAMSATELFPKIEGTCMSTQFSHIFQGGYAAGYYSYKWAEVLDADAFSLFKEKGIFDKETAQSFKDNILSKGGSEHPMELYKRFRGQEPTVDALLERAGLSDS
ncbi:M3 family metallopeptidase [Reichenbachiella versicolor]|uniref:M3 family metallopeptidase n=1 Tax=Reichenbachiella versicolor TaxID=1821036 RepID=UPI000D6EA5FF|nr:M3 family metallopeptidase [Reichenbachiella versicolor]